MRSLPLFLLTLALLAAPAHAAKPDAKQAQSLGAETDTSCRGIISGLPGPASIYSLPSICSCAHGATVEALKSLLPADYRADPLRSL